MFCCFSFFFSLFLNEKRVVKIRCCYLAQTMVYIPGKKESGKHVLKRSPKNVWLLFHACGAKTGKRAGSIFQQLFCSHSRKTVPSKSLPEDKRRAKSQVGLKKWKKLGKWRESGGASYNITKWQERKYFDKLSFSLVSSFLVISNICASKSVFVA